MAGGGGGGGGSNDNVSLTRHVKQTLPLPLIPIFFYPPVCVSYRMCFKLYSMNGWLAGCPSREFGKIWWSKTMRHIDKM